ncbi:MAG: hypothetical protein KKF41_03385 [Actinobacteria bacterium]|nr:hypothetical protein [Actinomycetota bacterium]MBU1945055.1 hypothetical protein [Actinomycetota bacterium]MBU2686609.1 hypothetical protein [Actinomycetota bacterium]
MARRTSPGIVVLIIAISLIACGVFTAHAIAEPVVVPVTDIPRLPWVRTIRVTKVEPSWAAAGTGGPLLVEGENFRQGDQIMICRRDGDRPSFSHVIEASDEMLAGGNIRCTISIPISPSGSCDVIVYRRFKRNRLILGELEDGFTVAAPISNPPEISEISPEKAVRGTSLRLKMSGAHFTPWTDVCIERDGQEFHGVDVSVQPPPENNSLSCTLNLLNAEWGNYDVLVTNSVGSTILRSGFTVSGPVPEISRTNTNHIYNGKTPSRIRIHGNNMNEVDEVVLLEGSDVAYGVLLSQQSTYLDCGFDASSFGEGNDFTLVVKARYNDVIVTDELTDFQVLQPPGRISSFSQVYANPDPANVIDIYGEGFPTETTVQFRQVGGSNVIDAGVDHRSNEGDYLQVGFSIDVTTCPAGSYGWYDVFVYSRSTRIIDGYYDSGPYPATFECAGTSGERHFIVFGPFSIGVTPDSGRTGSLVDLEITGSGISSDIPPFWDGMEVYMQYRSDVNRRAYAVEDGAFHDEGEYVRVGTTSGGTDYRKLECGIELTEDLPRNGVPCEVGNGYNLIVACPRMDDHYENAADYNNNWQARCGIFEHFVVIR